MSANRVTMRDVAKEAGVTSAAVSYALSGKRPISEETRRRVEQAIERLGYTPNMAARTLGSARQDSRLIGVVVPQTEAGSRLMFQNQFYSEILGSIELCARQKGYHVIISATDANESYLTLAKERNLDGIIVIGMYPDSFYQQMKESRIPIVLIDSYCNDHYYHTRCSRSFQNWIMGILSPPGPSSGLWTSVPVRLQMMMFTIRNTRPIITPGMIPALKRSGTEVLVEAP